MATALHHPECTFLDGGCDRRAPRRLQADPRLAAIADQLAESILATLEAHGYAIVREADTQGYDERRQRDFARESARNAVAIVAMEGGL